MSKTIIITEQQLEKILGETFVYTNKTNSGFPEYNGHTEVSVDGKVSDEEHGEPVTTDDIAKNLAKRDQWVGRGKIAVNCSVDKKKILKEENSAAVNKTWYIPDDIYMVLLENKKNYDGNRAAKGWDRLNNLIENRNVSYGEMKRLKNFFENEGKTDSFQYNLLGGNRMYQWVKNSLNSFRTAVSNDKANRKAMGFQNVYQKAGGTKQSGNGQAHTKKNNNGITYF